MKNLENGTEFIWPKEKFLNRLYLMKEMYNNYEEEDDDWDLPEVSILSLTHIRFCSKCLFTILVEKGERHIPLSIHILGKRSFPRRPKSRNHYRNGSSIPSADCIHGES